MKALKFSKTAIAIALASAALVTGCGENEEVAQFKEEATSTVVATEEVITPPAEVVANPDTGATAQTGANTNVEYGAVDNVDAVPAADVTAERSGPPAGETGAPHTTTDMLAVSPAPAAVEGSIATSDAAESAATPNITERTTPDAGANISLESSGAAMVETQQNPEAVGQFEEVEQQSSGVSEQQSGAISGAASDTWLTTKVKTALLADDQISGTDINVETANGEVMLSGFVENQQQIQQAEQAAQQVEGVRQVTNNLEVKQQQ